MRRAGMNPTEPELQDMVNKIDDGALCFADFCILMEDKNEDNNPENHFRDAFRVFSKDEQGGWWLSVYPFTGVIIVFCCCLG